jgi:PAS domain S-box-containing protein
MDTPVSNKIISINELWSFFNHSVSLFCIVDNDGYILDINPAFSKLLAYPEEKLLFKHFTDFIHPDDKEASIIELGKAKSGLPVIAFRVKLRNAAGEFRWVALTANVSPEGLVYVTGEDITGKKEVEEELERVALIAKKTKHGMTMTDKDLKIFWINEGFTNITGYTLDEVAGKKPLEVLGGPLTDNESNEFIKNLIKNQQPFLKEAINYRKNGEAFWMRVEGQPVFDDKGKLLRWIAVQTDISKQKMSEESIMLSEKKYRSIFNNSPLFNFICDPHTFQILEVNAAAINHYGYSLGEFMHLSLSDIISEKDAGKQQKMVDQLSKGAFHEMCKHVKKNGEIMSVDTSASLIEYKNNNAVLLIIKDITEQKRLQEELIKEKVNKERNILEATLHGQEMERVEIGKELHDNINQMLGSAKLYIEMALHNKKKSAEFIKTGIDILLASINEIRGLSKALVAPGIEELDLYESSRELVDIIMKGKDIQIDLFFDKSDEDLPYKIKLMLFRIIQEQTNNILKHAHAKIVNIQLLTKNGFIKLSIHDDGQGFDTSVKKNGIGLNNIAARAKLHNGTVNIRSKPGEGCLLEVLIPQEEVLKLAIQKRSA